MSRKFASSNYFRKKNPALHKAKPELFLHYKFHYSLYNKYRCTREQRNRKKTLFTICHDQCYNESRRTGNDPACRCCQDCRKCHSCKTCIWHIVQKGFYKRTGDLPFEKDSGSIRIRYVTPAITRIYRYTFGFISVCCLLFLCFFFLNRAEMCCQPCYQQCRDNDHKSGRNFIQYRNHCK